MKTNTNKCVFSKEPSLYRQRGATHFNKTRLSDKEYSKITQSMIIVCTDALIINRNKKTVFLAKRRAKPATGEWWYIGGRTFAGETFGKSVQRCFKRETGLIIPVSKFKFINIQNFIWAERQQHPQNIGTHPISFAFAVELTKKELAKISGSLDKKEYAGSGLKEFSRNELVKQRVHPAIIEGYDRIFK